MTASRAAAATLLLLFSASAVASVATPVLTVGDHWRYEIVDTATGDVVGTTTTRVVSVELERSATGPIDTARLDSETRAGADVTSTTSVWLRGDDLAIARSETRQARAGTTLYIVQKVAYDPPCVGYEWPLAPNRSWTSACSLERTTEVPGQPARVERSTETTATKVLRDERIEVPAGAFDATALEITRGTGSPTLLHFAAAACQPVRYESESQAARLVEYRCAATAGAPRASPAAGALAVLAVAGAIAILRKRT